MKSKRLEKVDREAMLRAAVRMTRQRGRSLWGVVGEVCGVGSTSAHEICRELGWEPSEEATKPLP